MGSLDQIKKYLVNNPSEPKEVEARMLFLLSFMAQAEPCQFTTTSDQSGEAENVELAYDDDPDTWAVAQHFELYLTLADDQELQSVGVELTSEGEFGYELQIMYLPVGGTSGEILVDEAGSMSAGTHQGTWSAEVETTDLLYALDVTDGGPVGIQLVCEADAEESDYRGGGGCQCGQEYGLAPQSAMMLLGLKLYTLRRRRYSS